MSMSLLTLKTALVGMGPTDSEASAITTLVDAYEEFASAATAALPTPIPLLPAGLAAGKGAMSLALVGMNSYNAAYVKIPAGVTAFWAAVAALGPLSFVGATLVTPPPHVSFATELQVVMLANIELKRNQEDALGAIAEIMYNNAILGGTVTIVTPVYGIV